jgi:DNA-binding MarR family transcriptional regulator
VARIPQHRLDAWRSLLNAHAAVIARAEEALAEAGLPPLAWYDVLWAVRRTPRRRVRLGELAEALTISRGGATKLVDRLEAEGLLRREPVPGDRRGAYAVLTAKGEAMLRRMWPVYARVLVGVLGGLDAGRAAVLRETLDAINERTRSRLSTPSQTAGVR